MFGKNSKRKILIILMVIALGFLAFKIVSNPRQSVPDIKEEQMVKQGEFHTWGEVNKLFPKFAKATIEDFETGKRFRVQRRAGSGHADVQPLTAQDTEIMKSLYNGRWSWKRRAIIVELEDGRRIAASMHGMPHGAGAISGNNFRGHFCLHFRDSKTHRSSGVNWDHQIMVWKAANKTDEMLRQLKQEEIMAVALAAVNQGEISLVKKVTDQSYSQAETVFAGLSEIEILNVSRIRPHKELPQVFVAEVGLIYSGSGKQHTKEIAISISGSSEGIWKIDPRSLLPLLDR